MSYQKFPKSKDRILFTPGPLTTSSTVKQAMLYDLGSRDYEFLAITQDVRKKLLRLANLSNDFTAVLLQGSGTYSVESVITSTTPPTGKVLVISNGAYGKRMAQIAETAKVPLTLISYAENEMPKLSDIESALQKDRAITNICMVHCETTSGIVNPIQEVGALAKTYGKIYFVDAMSSFGAVPIDLEACQIDYLVSSANKCIEGVPGVGFVIARRSVLEKTEGYARSLSLNLFAQWKDLENGGEFRYTPPIQTILALDQALSELETEGGVASRSARYQDNYRTLISGMRSLGFKEYLTPEHQGYIITSFHYLNHSKFNYKAFYERLHARDVVIYSGKVTNAECFRIGNIGRIFKSDVQNLIAIMRETLVEMGCL